jgi:Transglutaminase-like superfamily
VTRHTESSSPSIFSCRTFSLEISAQGGQRPIRFLLAKALAGLFVFDLLGFGRSFERMYRFVSSYKVLPCKPSAQTVDQVCNAINCACVWYPKRVLCLQRSAVTTWLLRTSGVPAMMVMGAQNLPFKAHAWTEVDGHAINERRNVQKIYGVLDRC